MVRLSRPSAASRRDIRRHKRLAERLRGSVLTGASALMDLVSDAVRHLPPRVRYLPADAITVPLAVLWSRRRRVTELNFAVMLGVPPPIRGCARWRAAVCRTLGAWLSTFLWCGP